MSTPTLTEWIKDFAATSDEDLWNQYVKNQRNWREDEGACHSAENVLSAVLEHRGILPASPQEVIWAALETLVPNRFDLKAALLAHIRENEYLFKQAQEQIAMGLTAAKHRGQRIGLGQFVHYRDVPKKLTLEMPWKVLGRDEAGHAMVDVTKMAEHAITKTMERIPEFCKLTGLREDQVEVKTSFLIHPDGNQHIMRVWLDRKR